jgi:tetratricopeptide (TPR) repeat protein
MINTKELEKRWYRYKAKGLILVFSILAVLLILIYGGYYILYKLDLNISLTEQESRQTAIMGTSKIIKERNSTVVEENQTATEKEEGSNDVLLAPTIPIVDLEREKRKDIEDRRRVTKKKRVDSKKRLVKAKTDTYLTAKELTVVNGSSTKSREKKKINLHRSSDNYMSIMKNKFQKNKNPREALLIAKAYYKAGNYKNAEEWALKANNLDKKLDESWLVFAKSQEKLGKGKEALKVLVAYYRTSKSPKAKALIEKIKAKSI